MKKIFTGIFAFMLFAGAAQAQETGKHGKGKHGGGHEMVAKELGLTDDQKAKLKSIHEAERAEMETLKSSTLADDQKKAKRMEIHQKYRSQRDAVLTADQKAKMEKFKSEHKGKGTRVGKEGKDAGRIQKADRADRTEKGAAIQSLNLTEDQKSKMARLREEFKSQHEALRNDKSLNEEQRREKMKSLRDQQQDKMKSILTQEQVQKLKEGKKDRKSKQTAR